MEIICKVCGYKWEQEESASLSIFYCPKCGTIGRLNHEFEKSAT
ncbi:MAG: DUF1660 family phage protein [Candidatus Helarchaeota archaeon]